MLEIPEAKVWSGQLSEVALGKKITEVTAGASPHGFAFYSAEHEVYRKLLIGKKFTAVYPLAGHIEMAAGDIRLDLSDGVNIRYFTTDKYPKKHQLYIEFADGSRLVFTIQMYGFMNIFREGENQNEYYLVTKTKPSPLSDEFDWNYFNGIIKEAKPSLSAKALLATEQRIPGLGNGTLQDILFNAGINPRAKIQELTEADRKKLFKSVKETLRKMVADGGRNTEKDIYGNPGGYQTILSSLTLKAPCRKCGDTLKREAYLGGNVYYCPACQPKK